MNMDYSAWEGFEIDGQRRHRAVSRGTVVVDDGEYVGTKGHGQFLQARPVAVPDVLRRGAPMDFGVVLQTNPPASRVVELARQAELLGFTHVWTFDSHLLWQEPYVIYSQILAQTRNGDRRADGDQPGHPRLDRDRVARSRR